MMTRTPRVLVDLEPVVFADAICRSLRAGGFVVLVGSATRTAGAFDVAILGEGSTPVDVPVTLVVGTDSRVVVRLGEETGVMSVAGPGDLLRVLRSLLVEQVVDTPAG